MYVIFAHHFGHSTYENCNTSFRKHTCSECQRNLFLLTTYRTKADLPSLDVKEQYFSNRTIFHNKFELLKCCGYRVHVYVYTVNSRYLDFGYLESPLISKRKFGPCFNTEI